MKKQYLCTEHDMPEALVADGMTRTLVTGKRVFVVNDKTCIVVCTPLVKRIIVLTVPPYDFQFIPVGEALPSAPEEVVDDYREGVSSTDAETGQRTPGNRIWHTTIGPDETLTHKVQGAHCGTSTWYGDTENVISWHGIGSMDACGNDYRTFTATDAVRYQNPVYEHTYYPRAAEAYAAPDTTYHLRGDRYFTATVQEKYTHDHCTVYRNGGSVAHMQWSVLAACEVEVTLEDGSTALRLRVLCGRWFDTPTQRNPVLGNPDLYLEYHTLTGFYLYDERDDGSFGVRMVEIPEAVPPYGNESCIAQAPVFSADGSRCAGLLETSFGAASAYYHVPWGSKDVTTTQAWVFSIDAATATCTLVEPASTYRYQRDKTDTALSLTTREEFTQTLCVYPDASGGFTRSTLTESTTAVKDRLDSETTYLNNSFVYRYGTLADSMAYQEAYLNSIRAQVWAEAVAVVLAAIYPSTNLSRYRASFVVDAYTNTNAVYPYKPFAGGASTLTTGIIIDLPSGGLGHLEFLGGYLQYVAGISAQLEDFAKNIGSFQITPARARSQTVTTTTAMELAVAGTVAAATSKVDSTTSAGYSVPWAGNGYAYTGVSGLSGFDLNAHLSADASYGIVYSGGSSTTGATPDTYKLIAADMRKSAGVVKNTTQGTHQFIGVRSTEL